MELDFEIFHHNVHLQMTSFFSKIKAYYPYIFLKKRRTDLQDPFHLIQGNLSNVYFC
ncbi:hypothetical protein B4143_2500 [Bacillus subtilis]|uniref:Uncharacterized protein n=1 Tax=Bacillus subtilis TaxID=1423 RepID=A0AAP1EAY0_BACIU|nr:hypothetical protein B4146_2680 [Bacillus subtilis]NDK00297.1 hypothetical protein [Bacillus subtilis subsp. subtilis]KIO59771.1 hypothetical protein B4143_2500 [Bacillus subtilis]KZD88774.1 hypothetical protein B4122_4199 [Bacillus subtilis]KZD91774.1 hypothetical protein B4122_2416 [Bacillus subtilis]